MPRSPRKLLVADLFCGAGGFTSGLTRELDARGIGYELVAVNHNPIAIATHSRNHPRARHEIADVNTADPEKLVPEGYLDILLASPTCTFHSRARGGKPTSDQERMDPWAIVAWCTKLRVKRLRIENVPEFVDWGPIDPRSGRPIPSRKGEYFRAWTSALNAIGMHFSHRNLVCADFGDATTRRRFFLGARHDRKPVVWPVPTHSREGVRDLFGTMEKWRAAREIIDWKDRGSSIFGRRVPLKPNTLRRILAGALKLTGVWREVFRALLTQELYRSRLYWEAGVGMRPPKKANKRKPKKGAKKKAPQVLPHPWRFDEQMPQLQFTARDGQITRVERSPFMLLLNGSSDSHLSSCVRDVAAPLPTITAQGGHIGLVQPFVFQVNQSNGRYRSFRSVNDPLYAVLTRDSYGLTDFDLSPFTLANRHNNAAREISEPVAALTTAHGGGILLCSPGVFLLAQGSNGAPQRADADPVPSITTVSRIQLVEPVLRPFVLGQQGGAVARDTGEPLPTIATGGAIRLAQPIALPFMLNRHGENGAACRGRSLDDPCFTATRSGGGYLVEPYLVAMKKQSECAVIGAPLPAITTRRHLGMIEPFLVVVNHGGGAERQAPRSTDRPLSAITTHRGYALVDPFLTPYYGEGSGKTGRSVDMPVPAITSRDRFALIMPAFLVPNFGERPGQPPRWHPLESPLPAVTGHGAGQLVEPFVINTRHSRDGGGPRPRSVNDPLATITGSGHGEFSVVSPSPEADSGRVVYVDGVPVLVDILFRMLRNPELAAAMSFTDEEYKYEFTGTATQITKQIGNAVPVRTARALVKCDIDDLIAMRQHAKDSAHQSTVLVA